MIGEIIKAFAIAIVITNVKAHVTPWTTTGQLHPVHGLYVKPSVDGTTGDLYVAATEETGTTSQWLTDKPINFLPIASASQNHQTIPFTYASSLTTLVPQEDTIAATQKRAVITSPTVKYAYAYPRTTTEGGTASPYPYAVLPATPATAEETNTPPTGTEAASPALGVPQYSPYNFFYPQWLSTAFMNSMGMSKEPETNDETTSLVATQGATMWSPTAYTYPFHYVMVDPSAWLQSQTAAVSSTTTTPTTASTQENNNS